MMRLAYGQIKTVDRETMMNARQMGIDRCSLICRMISLLINIGNTRIWPISKGAVTNTA